MTKQRKTELPPFPIALASEVKTTTRDGVVSSSPALVAEVKPGDGFKPTGKRPEASVVARRVA